MDDPEERKYAAPKPGVSGRDELHEWAIYRQNLTSSLAQNLFPGKTKMNGKPNLPFGDFQMHDQTVEAVLNRGKRVDSVGLLDQGGGEAYLKYGLPRIGITSNNLPGDRKSRSEMDLRRTEAAASGGSYDANSIFGPPRRGPYALQPSDQHRVVGYNRRFQSVEYGLHNVGGTFSSVPRGNDYALSEVGGFGLVPENEIGPDLGALTPSSVHEYNGLLRGHHPFKSELEGDRGIYWQTKSRHHHGHYFSNLDLFTQPHNAYNYLRYAKADDLGPTGSKQPHLVLRHVGFTVKKHRVLDNISMEFYGGDTVAVMYTSAEEIQTFLDVLTHQHGIQGRFEGEIFINGFRIKPAALGSRVGYVCRHGLYEDLSVRDHLGLIKDLSKPTTTGSRSASMISQLIHTLALAPFADRLVRDLGRTEKQRVKVACQILLDTDILVLDDVMSDMDLYDVAFLIDYLRDWAMKLNRIVIVATNPQTYELLSMYSKTALLASGKLIYCGLTSRMLDYFEAAGYPYPLFKNPCDYYVDLVTHDTLNFDASQESDERVRSLSNAWLAKNAAPPEPGIPGVPPPRIQRTNFCSAIWWIYFRFWRLFSSSPWSYVFELALSCIMSVLLGTTFYALSHQQAGINDRMGLFHTLATLYLLPNLCFNIHRARKERCVVYYDNLHSLYPKPCYLISKMLFDFPFAVTSYLLYGVPVYFMSQLQRKPLDSRLGLFLGVLVLYCLALRMLAWLVTYLSSKKVYALAVLGVLLSYFALTSNVTTHPSDMRPWMRLVQRASPSHWAVQGFAVLEFDAHPLVTRDHPTLPRTPKYTCKRKPYQHGSSGLVIGSRPCPIATNAEVQRFYGNFTQVGELGKDSWLLIGLPVIAAWGVGALVLSCFAFMINYKPPKQAKHESVK